MTLEQIRAWAETVGSKNREELRTQVLAATFFLVMASLWLSRSSSLNEQIAFAVAILWFLAGQYHAFFVRRPRRLPADAGLTTTLTFLREELYRKRDLIRLGWLRFLGPVFLMIGIFLVPKLAPALNNYAYLGNAAPFLLLLGVWAIAFAVMRRRKTRELRAELEELDRLERESGSAPKA
jgi:hypothetical protein